MYVKIKKNKIFFYFKCAHSAWCQNYIYFGLKKNLFILYTYLLDSFSKEKTRSPEIKTHTNSFSTKMRLICNGCNTIRRHIVIASLCRKFLGGRLEIKIFSFSSRFSIFLLNFLFYHYNFKFKNKKD